VASPVAFNDPSGQFIDFANHVLHLGFAVAGIYGAIANYQLAAQEIGQSINLFNSGNDIEGIALFASGVGHIMLAFLGAAGAGSALAKFNPFPGALRLVGGKTVQIAAGGVTALEYGGAVSAAAAILWMAMADPNRGDGPSPRTPVGRSGEQHEWPNPNAPRPRNAPATINGRDYSGHAIDRMQERGFVPSVVENAIKNGTPTAGRDATTIFTDIINNIRVIVDSATGRVITIIPG